MDSTSGGDDWRRRKDDFGSVWSSAILMERGDEDLKVATDESAPHEAARYLHAQLADKSCSRICVVPRCEANACGVASERTIRLALSFAMMHHSSKGRRTLRKGWHYWRTVSLGRTPVIFCVSTCPF